MTGDQSEGLYSGKKQCLLLRRSCAPLSSVVIDDDKTLDTCVFVSERAEMEILGAVPLLVTTLYPYQRQVQFLFRAGSVILVVIYTSVWFW